VSPDTTLLVLLSAILHAGWNFLLKGAGGSQVVVALAKVAEVALFAPAFFLWSLPTLPGPGVVALFAGVAATGVLMNYAALATAYRHGDLSFVYPISRGAALLFLPVAGGLAFGERVSALEAFGLTLIVGGITVLQLKSFSAASLGELRQSLGSPATRYALLAALTAALYTIWDKRAVQVMQPFGYMFLYTALVAAAYAVWLVRHVPHATISAEWRRHRAAIVAIGGLNTVSYLLTLIALKSGVSSVVIGLRQLSIVFGVLMGWLLLRERLTRPRIAGTLLIVSGCLLLAT
jgi:uncharacterized membrane protein